MNTLQRSLDFEKAILQCTDTLQGKNNAEQSLATLLKILGEYYASDSSYIFEFDEETQIFGCNYQWNSKEKVEFANTFADLPFSALEYFSSDYFAEAEIPLLCFVPKHYPEAPITYLFEEVENLVVSPMFRKGVTTGFVGITNVSFENFDARLFSCVILFMQECLQKREMHLQLALLHNLDPLTGFFNKEQYSKKLKILEEKPPHQLGILFVQLTGVEKTGEIYGSKYVDMKIKNASWIMSQFFDFPFYRIERQKFVCFVLNIDEETFLSVADQMRLESTSNSDACFTIGHSWSEGDINIHQEIGRTYSGFQENSEESVRTKFRSPTECLLSDLSKAIEEDCFRVHLQPKVELSTGKIVGAEALVRRMILKTGELVSPDVFVPLYENHTIVRHLDLHIMRTVCKLLNEWGKLGHEIPISVNFSRVTLTERGIAKEIKKICQEYDISPSMVQIEITERLGSAPDELNELLLDDFKQAGLRLVLDDFGSTYSNFLNLIRMDIEEVKIDHSLVENMEHNLKNQKILKTIVDMCNSLGGTSSLAEGVETEEQRNILMELKCQYGQGFFFSPPLSQEEFCEKYLL